MNNLMNPLPPKGFRDFLPNEARQREILLTIIRSVFNSYGFEPLETPTIEYASTLLGKYGNEADKLLYLFKDRGDREIGLRYDLTVPLCRVIALNQNLTLPFKRYQIQPVYRAEKPQKGRFREFLQCDIDIVGVNSYLADAEVILCTLQIFKKLGFKKTKIIINDRTIFDSLELTKETIIIIDKLAKIGKDNVLKELEDKGIKNGLEIFTSLEKTQPTKRLESIFKFLSLSGFKEGQDFEFSPFLARGLDYYTSTIYEVVDSDYPAGSLAGGGRYDNLIGSFTGKNLPAVGISFGIDRVIEAMNELKLFSADNYYTQILVTIFSPAELNKSIELTNNLRQKGYKTELYLEDGQDLAKQLKFANKKGIPYVVIIGPDEVKKNGFVIKDMAKKTQMFYSNIKEINI